MVCQVTVAVSQDTVYVRVRHLRLIQGERVISFSLVHFIILALAQATISPTHDYVDDSAPHTARYWAEWDDTHRTAQTVTMRPLAPEQTATMRPLAPEQSNAMRSLAPEHAAMPAPKWPEPATSRHHTMGQHTRVQWPSGHRDPIVCTADHDSHTHVYPAWNHVAPLELRVANSSAAEVIAPSGEASPASDDSSNATELRMVTQTIQYAVAAPTIQRDLGWRLPTHMHHEKEEDNRRPE
jgi:hypothetical protein